jgi:hypothetical protein
MKYKKVKNMPVRKHVIIRLYLYFLLFLFFITGGLMMFVLAPLYKSAFAPCASYKDFTLSKVLRIWAHVYKVIWRSLSDKTYRDMYPSKITDAPKFYNDRRFVRIKESWNGADENCDLCPDSCCKQLKCPMLDKSGLRCLSYDSIYFGYLFCGRYPENQSQINLYQCPKWEIRPENENENENKI